MIPRLFALLLIVNLLACPVRCLSCEVKTVAGEECMPAACSCCSHGDEAPVPVSPEPCGDDCNCQNCICQGAVVEVAVELPDSVDQSARWVRPMMAANPTVALFIETSLRRSRAQIGHLHCGRDRRVAYQSWLI